MFEIVKKFFYFTPDIIYYEFQLSLKKTTEPVATAGTSFH